MSAHLRRRGDRALLARELNAHRARIGEYFCKRTARPDAERALEVLLWLSHQPSAIVSARTPTPEARGREPVAPRGILSRRELPHLVAVPFAMHPRFPGVGPQGGAPFTTFVLRTWVGDGGAAWRVSG